jgi:DNA-binding SARP family transcriptional activator
VSTEVSSPSEPTGTEPAALLRGRLVEALRGRFDRRLTVITAGAGFGKSTLVGQAADENRIEHLGTDVLLRLTGREQDPDRLLERLAEPLGAPGSQIDVDRVVELVWSSAPESVALVLDDCHRLGESAAWEVLGLLLDRLPSNGHLVLSGRVAPRLATARLVSTGDALIITEGDLAFTDDEVASFAALRSVPEPLAASLPRWPALATLTSTVGHSASIDYLWEEVLADLSDERRDLLAAAALFGEVDDELIAALGSVMSAAEVVCGLPLVGASTDGSFRLHDLWVDALDGAITVERRDEALRFGGRMLRQRGELGRAGEAFAVAGDDQGMAEVLLTFARRPTLTADVREIDHLLSVVPPAMKGLPGARYLAASRHSATDDRQAAEAFSGVAEAAEAAGDVELEMLARWRQVQFADLDRPGGPPDDDRVASLADEGVPLARAVGAFTASRRAQLAGDPDESIRLLAGLDDFGPEQRATSRAIRLVDLGRPEALDASLDQVLADGVSDIYAAQAVWLQGQIDPVLAWPIARELPDRGGSMTIATRVALTSVVVAMGVSAGALDEVTVLSRDNLRNAGAAAGLIRLFAEVASALVELSVDGEAAAVASFVELLDEVPLGEWPERPYLYALAVIRGLVPGGERLDGCVLGPSMSVAVEAGAALASLRAGDSRPAARLPWSKPTLLRVHVPPPLLAELAVATGDARDTDEVLRSIPHLRLWLRRIADSRVDRGATPAVVRTRAGELARSLPARPGHDLRIEVLGGLSLERSDGRQVDGWDRRSRVRDLLAYLALGRDVARSEVADHLWPELSHDKAAANLRVNLHHLQRALQPEREPDERPWFLRSDGGRLWLVTDGVTIDSELLDDAMVEAVRAEAAGLPSEALHHYERVAELAKGDLLAGMDAEWAVYERIRLRSVVQAAASRQAELVLARGEPETALGIAARAQRLDPLSERAHRVLLRCHLALGSTGAARESARLLQLTLADEGMTPEHETLRLLDRIESRDRLPGS